MAEYIERAALYQTLERRYKYSSGAAHKAYGIAVDDVLDAPAADVAPVVRGRWEYDPVEEVRTCTNCGGKVDSCFYPNYCPRCGAKMEEQTWRRKTQSSC